MRGRVGHSVGPLAVCAVSRDTYFTRPRSYRPRFAGCSCQLLLLLAAHPEAVWSSVWRLRKKFPAEGSGAAARQPARGANRRKWRRRGHPRKRDEMTPASIPCWPIVAPSRFSRARNDLFDRVKSKESNHVDLNELNLIPVLLCSCFSSEFHRNNSAVKSGRGLLFRPGRPAVYMQTDSGLRCRPAPARGTACTAFRVSALLPCGCV